MSEVGAEAAERREVRRHMRAGIAGWVVRTAGGAGDGLRRLTPRAMVAFLTGSAFAEIASAGAGLPAMPAAALLAGMGGNYLSGVLERTATRLRAEAEEGGGDGDAPAPDIAQLTDAIARQIEEALEAGGDGAAALRAEMAAVLREIDAAEAALGAAIETASMEMSDQVLTALGRVATELDEFGFLLDDVRTTLAQVLDETSQIRTTLHRQHAEQRAERDQRRHDSTRLTQLYELARTLEARTRTLSTRPSAAGSTPGSGHAGAAAEASPPYRGLLPFEEDHASLFYGREHVTAALVDRLAERSLARPAMLVVSGASGVGKSSLLRAGFLPALARGALPVAGSADWPRIVVTPTRAPVAELAAHLAAVGGVDRAALGRDLAARPEEAHLAVRQVLLATERTPPGRLVLVVDQFEELFAPGIDDERRTYLTAIRAMAETPCGPDDEPPALVVIGLRGDFWEAASAEPALAPVLQDGQFVVTAMDETDLARAISGPAAAAGLHVERNLIETVLHDLRHARDPAARGSAGSVGALPLLSQALLVTWENRSEDSVLTVRGYERSGGVGHVVQTSAEEAYDALTSGQQAAARMIFRRMVALRPGGRATRRRVPREELLPSDELLPSGELDAVLDAFADKRLIVLDRGAVEIAHDTLVDAWPRLQSWLEADRASQVLHDQLVEAAAEWSGRGRDSSFLYQGTRLEAVRDEIDRWDADPWRFPPLPGPARAFVDASRSAAARASRRRRLAVSGLVVLLVVALVAAVAAVQQSRTARGQRDRAAGGRLVAESELLRDRDPDLSRLLAVGAWQVDPSPEARHRMLDSLTGTTSGALVGRTGPVTSLAFSPDGELVATAGHNTVAVWDVATRRLVGGRLEGHEGTVEAVAFSPDGQTLASGAADGTVRLWDAATGDPRGDPLAGGDGTVWAVAFSPDGLLATAGEDGTVRLWDPETRQPSRRPLEGHVGVVRTLAFSPDGQTLVTGGDDGTTRLWQVGTGQPIGSPITVAGPDEDVYSVAFSPDGATLAVAAQDVWLWDVRAGRPSGDPLQGGTAIPQSVAFSPDGAVVATGGVDGSVRLWDPETHRLLAPPLDGHANNVASLAFSPDGETLVSGSWDGSARLWDVSTLRHPIGEPLTGHDDAVWSTAFGPDGDMLASASRDGTVRLWDAHTGEAIGRPLDAGTGSVQSVAFSPDGDLLAVGGLDGSIRLWAVATGDPVGEPLEGHDGLVSSVAFSPEGDVLATASTDETVRLWEVASGAPVGEPLDDHEGEVWEADFSPDGTTLATASSDGTVQVWDVATRRREGPALDHGAVWVTALAFGPDGTTLATGTIDSTVRLWDVASRQQLGTSMEGHSDWINAVDFSPDGRTLASGSDDETVRLWDVGTSREIGDPLMGHTSTDPFTLRYLNWVASVAFGPEDHMLVTASADRTLLRWDMSVTAADDEELVDLVCERTGRALTRDEWERYVPDVPFREVCA